MAASCKDLILSTLQELGKEDFIVFIAYLRDEDFLARHNFTPIPLVHLEDKSYVDVAERIISHHTKERAPELMEIVLEKIGQKQLAESFRTCGSTNIINILAKHLNRLSKSSLAAFILDLCSLKVPPGCKQIQREHLERKTPEEVAKIIINSYTTRHGPTKVKQVLKNINENQIRIDLEKELKATPQTGGGQVSAADQKQNIGASPKTLNKSTEIAEPMASPTGCEPGKSQQPGDNIKPQTGRKPSNTSQTGCGQVSIADQKQNAGNAEKRSKTLKKPTVIAEPMEDPTECEPGKQLSKDIKPEIAGKPRTAHLMGSGQVRAEDQKTKVGTEEMSMTLSKLTLNSQPTGGPTGCKLGEKQQLGEDINPDTGRKPPTDSRMDDGPVSIGDQKQNARARKSSKLSRKQCENAQPAEGPTECKMGKSQQLGEDVKPELGRKTKAEPKTLQKSAVKAKISGGQVTEEQSGEDVKSKPESKRKNKENR